MWHEEQIDELFSSLLGKGFESVNVDDKGYSMDMDDPATSQPITEPVGLAGLRVF